MCVVSRANKRYIREAASRSVSIDPVAVYVGHLPVRARIRPNHSDVLETCLGLLRPQKTSTVSRQCAEIPVSQVPTNLAALPCNSSLRSAPSGLGGLRCAKTLTPRSGDEPSMTRDATLFPCAEQSCAEVARGRSETQSICPSVKSTKASVLTSVVTTYWPPVAIFCTN